MSISDRVDRVFAVSAENSGFILFGYIFLTSVLLILSNGIGNNLTEFSGQVLSGAGVEEEMATKQVGYWVSLNWSVVGVLMPCALYFFLNARADLISVARNLAARKMILRCSTTSGAETYEPLDESEIQGLLRRHKNFGAFAMLGVVGLVVTFGLFDFFNSVLDTEKAIAAGPVKLSDPDTEFDWSVAFLFDPSLADARGAILAFGFAAFFIIPICGAAVVYGSYVYIFFIINGFSRAVSRDDEIVMIADLVSADPRDRMGFEIFEGFVANLIRGLYCVFVSLVLMSHQNMFLRDPSAANIYEFYVNSSPTLSADFGEMVNVLLRSIHIMNTQTIITIITTMTVLMFLIFWAFKILRDLAFEAKSEAEAAFRRHKKLRSNGGGGAPADEAIPAWSSIPDHNIGLVEQRLEGMKVWPLSWSNLNHAIILLVLMGIAAVFPGLILLGLAFVAFKLLERLASLVSTGKG